MRACLSCCRPPPPLRRMAQLALLRDESLLWSPAGLRSLAKSASIYM